MKTATHVLSDLESKAASGHAFSLAEAERVLAAVDLVSVGVLGEAARRAHSGDTVTFGRVALAGQADLEAADAGELRVGGVPATAAEAADWVRGAAASAAGTAAAKGAVLTGFSLADLFELSAGNPGELGLLAAALREAGLVAIAETPIDAFASVDALAGAIEAVGAAGLGVWRATVQQAVSGDRLDLIARAALVQRRTGSFRAFAPLPRVDPAEMPSTGYDDVRTIAVARLVCAGIPSIQVDWPLYGPKLAQVAITFGANDIDGVDAVDRLNLGHRRAPAEDIARQIRAASGVPAERNGRYEPRS